MSLQAQPLDPIPALSNRIAHASLPKGTLVMHLRDAPGSLYGDADLADVFPKRGRAAEAPWRLALVTVLHALENLSGPKGYGKDSFLGQPFIQLKTKMCVVFNDVH